MACLPHFCCLVTEVSRADLIKNSSGVGGEEGEAQEITACPGLKRAGSWPFDRKGGPSFSSPHTLCGAPLRAVRLFGCPSPLILPTPVGQAEQTWCAR